MSAAFCRTQMLILNPDLVHAIKIFCQEVQWYKRCKKSLCLSPFYNQKHLVCRSRTTDEIDECQKGKWLSVVLPEQWTSWKRDDGLYGLCRGLCDVFAQSFFLSHTTYTDPEFLTRASQAQVKRSISKSNLHPIEWSVGRLDVRDGPDFRIPGPDGTDIGGFL